MVAMEWFVAVLVGTGLVHTGQLVGRLVQFALVVARQLFADIVGIAPVELVSASVAVVLWSAVAGTGHR